jgi:hypothetical protein
MTSQRTPTKTMIARIVSTKASPRLVHRFGRSVGPRYGSTLRPPVSRGSLMRGCYNRRDFRPSSRATTARRSLRGNGSRAPEAPFWGHVADMRWRSGIPNPCRPSASVPATGFGEDPSVYGQRPRPRSRTTQGSRMPPPGTTAALHRPQSPCQSRRRPPPPPGASTNDPRPGRESGQRRR